MDPSHRTLSNSSEQTKLPIHDEHQRRHSKDTLPQIEDEEPISGEVNIAEAERTFAELRRQLTQASSLHLAQEGKLDGEKQDADATFDLLAFLRGTAQSRDEHGFRPNNWV